jgi:hypothetical protein
LYCILKEEHDKDLIREAVAVEAQSEETLGDDLQRGGIQ